MKKSFKLGRTGIVMSAILCSLVVCGIVVYAASSLDLSSYKTGNLPFAEGSTTARALSADKWDELMATLETLGGGIPAGAVMSFNLDACPDGWKPYDRAAGRSIRGIGGYPYYQLGALGGSDNIYISEQNLPRHTHYMFTDEYVTDRNFDKSWNKDKFNMHIAVENEHKDGDGNYSYTMAAAQNANKSPSIGRTSYVGGNMALEIDDPFVVLRYCEKL